MMQIATTTAPTGTSTGIRPADPQAKADLEKTAKAFEAIFLRQMISTMRSSSLGEGLTDSSESTQFRDMADSQTADNMAETGRFGIADMLVKQLGATVAPNVQIKPVAEEPAT